jgi:hypothetical protein
LLAANAVHAQCPPPGNVTPPGEGEIGLFLDPDATQNCINPPQPLTVVRLYVVTRVPEGGLAEFEGPTILPSSGTGFLLLSRTVPPIAGYEPLIVIDGCAAARRVDEGSCPVTQGDLLVLSVIELLAVSPATGVYCFRSACESIAGVVARAPRYRRCDTGTDHEFTGGETMCIGIGTAPVAVQPRVWSSVKSLYAQD